jgi:ATP/maltotriose-dependent transcriptional regulator MalT
MDAVAKLYLDAGDLDAAESTARAVLKIYEKSLPPRHLYVAATRHLLGEVLLRRGQLQAAEAELRAALDIDHSSAGPDDWRAARTEASLGWLLIEKNDSAEGEPMLVEARSELLKKVGPLHPEVQLATKRLADYYREHHREAEAARVLGEVKQPAASALR